MSTFTPSPYQKALFDWIENGKGSAIVSAVAGSGKTTTVVKSLKMIDPKNSILFLAFNKSIAEELKQRTPSYVQCMTMNSLGHRAVMKTFGRVELDQYKTTKILRDMEFRELISKQDVQLFGKAIKKLVGICKSVGLVPKDHKDKVALVEDTPEEWMNLIRHYDIESCLPGDVRKDSAPSLVRVIGWTREVLSAGLFDTRTIDFNDQLYLPVVFNLKLNTYDWVFVDEAQDISPIQRELLVKALKPTKGRLVAVGDPHQAIYGFRGADSSSMANIKERFKCTELPLSISYRCPKSIVREAQRYVSHIESAETASEGVVHPSSPVDLGAFRPKDMVVCRFTAPVVKLAYQLIKSNVAAKVLGRDIGEGLINLINRLAADDLNDLREKLEAWAAREIAKLKKEDPEADDSSVVDKAECIYCFLENSGAKTILELQNSINLLFGDPSDNNVVRLSTIHKSKGLEAERVFFLNSENLPPAWARLPHQIQQEHNLFYVAVTRAMKELFYITC